MKIAVIFFEMGKGSNYTALGNHKFKGNWELFDIRLRKKKTQSILLKSKIKNPSTILRSIIHVITNYKRINNTIYYYYQ